jgi:hypothetical protein
MIDRNVLRLGGICGLLFVILFIPSYVSAPDTPSPTSSIQEVLDYFAAGQSGIVFLNGVLLIFASFFFLWFLGSLHAVLQHAERDGYAFGSVTLIGGLLFVALMLAGAAIEIVHPRPRRGSPTFTPMRNWASCRSRSRGGCTASPLSAWQPSSQARRSSHSEPASCQNGWFGPVGYARWWRCFVSSARWAAG